MDEMSVPTEIIFYHGAFVHSITPEGPLQPQSQTRDSASLRKLSGFSEKHLIELSSDMYDELQRRVQANGRKTGPLAPRNDIHWKRNDARRHVGSLPEHRFCEICRDLVTEQERRYPELKTGPTYPLQDSMPMAVRPTTPSWISRGSLESTHHVSNPSNPSITSELSANSKENGGITTKKNDSKLQIQSVSESNITPIKAHIIESDSESDDDFRRSRRKSELRKSSVVASQVRLSTGRSPKSSRSPKSMHDLLPKEAAAGPNKLYDDEDSEVTLDSDLEESVPLAEYIHHANEDVKRGSDEPPVSSPTASEHSSEKSPLDRDRKTVAPTQLLSPLSTSAKVTGAAVQPVQAKDSVASSQPEPVADLSHPKLVESAAIQPEKHTQSAQTQSELAADIEPTPPTSQPSSETNRTAEPRNITGSPPNAQLLTESKIPEQNAERSAEKLVPSRPNPVETEQAAEIERLQQEVLELRQALATQKSVTTKVRQEAVQFLREMRELTEQHEQQISRAEHADLEVVQWKRRHSKLLKEFELISRQRIDHCISLPAVPQPFPSQYKSANGVVSQRDLNTFLSSVSALVSVIRQKHHSQDVLDILHEIITASRKITTKETLISRCANQLISVVRNYTVSTGLFPKIIVDSACSDITTAVIDFVKTNKLKISDSHGSENETRAPTSMPRSAVDDQPNHGASTTMPRNLTGLSIAKKIPHISIPDSNKAAIINKENSASSAQMLSSGNSNRQQGEKTDINHQHREASVGAVSKDEPLAESSFGASIGTVNRVTVKSPTVGSVEFFSRENSSSAPKSHSSSLLNQKGFEKSAMPNSPYSNISGDRTRPDVGKKDLHVESRSIDPPLLETSRHNHPKKPQSTSALEDQENQKGQEDRYVESRLVDTPSSKTVSSGQSSLKKSQPPNTTEDRGRYGTWSGGVDRNAGSQPASGPSLEANHLDLMKKPQSSARKVSFGAETNIPDRNEARLSGNHKFVESPVSPNDQPPANRISPKEKNSLSDDSANAFPDLQARGSISTSDPRSVSGSDSADRHGVKPEQPIFQTSTRESLEKLKASPPVPSQSKSESKLNNSVPKLEDTNHSDGQLKSKAEQLIAPTPQQVIIQDHEIGPISKSVQEALGSNIKHLESRNEQEIEKIPLLKPLTDLKEDPKPAQQKTGVRPEDAPKVNQLPQAELGSDLAPQRDAVPSYASRVVQQQLGPISHQNRSEDSYSSHNESMPSGDTKASLLQKDDNTQSSASNIKVSDNKFSDVETSNVKTASPQKYDMKSGPEQSALTSKFSDTKVFDTRAPQPGSLPRENDVKSGPEQSTLVSKASDARSPDVKASSPVSLPQVGDAQRGTQQSTRASGASGARAFDSKTSDLEAPKPVGLPLEDDAWSSGSDQSTLTPKASDKELSGKELPDPRVPKAFDTKTFGAKASDTTKSALSGMKSSDSEQSTLAPKTFDMRDVSLPQNDSNSSGYKHAFVPKSSDTRASDSRVSDTKVSDTGISDRGLADSRVSDPRASDTGASDTRVSDTRAVGTETSDTRGSSTRATDDAQATDTQATDAQATENKTAGFSHGDVKSSEPSSWTPVMNSQRDQTPTDTQTTDVQATDAQAAENKTAGFSHGDVKSSEPSSWTPVMNSQRDQTPDSGTYSYIDSHSGLPYGYSPRFRPLQGPLMPRDESALALHNYLEEQTSYAVDAIGALLSAIKTNAVAGELKPLIVSIQTLVGSMIERTAKSLGEIRSAVLKEKGTFIVQNMRDCLTRMDMIRLDELEAIRDDARPNRHLKQRLAGVNFDMAKCTKELIKSVEEVVLEDEMADLDGRMQ